MDLRRFSLVRGASVTGGSGGVAGTRGGCEGVTGVNRGGTVGGVTLSTATESQRTGPNGVFSLCTRRQQLERYRHTHHM